MTLEPEPSAALVCQYGTLPASTSGSGGRLTTEVRLGTTGARMVADAAGAVALRPLPSGPVSCPAELGTVTIVSFTSAGSTPRSLWWHTSGCQTLDNGRVITSQLANPSFWHFQTAFRDALRESIRRYPRSP